MIVLPIRGAFKVQKLGVTVLTHYEMSSIFLQRADILVRLTFVLIQSLSVLTPVHLHLHDCAKSFMM